MSKVDQIPLVISDNMMTIPVTGLAGIDRPDTANTGFTFFLREPLLMTGRQRDVALVRLLGPNDGGVSALADIARYFSYRLLQLH